MSTTSPSPTTKLGTPGIDPRSPRFGAGITAVLLLGVIALGLLTPGAASFAERLAQPAVVGLTALALLFGWGAFAGIRRHPYGALFRILVRPRLGAPAELEDPTPPTFAQGVGFTITLLGVLLELAGVPYSVVVAASAAFVAAFLNSAFGYCLGCQIYLLLARLGIVGRRGATAG